MTTIFPPIPELDYRLVIDALQGYAFPRKALSDALTRGDLLRIKKGIYVQSGRGIPEYSKEILANMIYGPSYISFEYALAYHGLIPERVEELTSATSGKRKSFDSPIGRFSYIHLPVHYYGLAFFRKELEEERAFLIATPEKAIADRIFAENGRFSIRSMRQFLFENLRMDPSDFRNLEEAIFADAYRLSGRRSLELLYRVRKEMS